MRPSVHPSLTSARHFSRAASRVQYLLNVGSNGYANKLKYLFLTGSVVIWVRKDSLNYEFFESHFIPGIHYASVDTVEEARASPPLGP